jgi:hypothetical protein
MEIDTETKPNPVFSGVNQIGVTGAITQVFQLDSLL